MPCSVDDLVGREGGKEGGREDGIIIILGSSVCTLSSMSVMFMA